LLSEKRGKSVARSSVGRLAKAKNGASARSIGRLVLVVALIAAIPLTPQKAQAATQDDEINVLHDLEENLAREKAEAENSGRTASQLRTSVYQLLEGMNEQELRTILEIDPEQATTVDPAKLQNVQEAERLAIEWDRAETKYQATIDDLTNRELDYFIKSTMLAMKVMKTAMDESVSKGRVSTATKLETTTSGATGSTKVSNSAVDANKIAEAHNAAKKSFAAYVVARRKFGGPKDGPQRTEPYREFFAEAKAFFDSAAVTQAESLRPAKSFWTKLKEKASGAYIRAQLVVKVVPPVLRTLLISWTIPKSGPGEAPLQTRGIHNVFAAIKDVAGYKVEIEGREFLPKGEALTGKTVNLIVPTHRNPILDQILMSAFDLKSYLLVMAPMPLLGDVDTMVTVTHGAKPVDKILQQLALGKTDTVVIYPEGSVGAGLYETRPVREKFVSGLVTELRDAGYGVNLIPVTYINSGRFVDENSIGAFFKTVGHETGTILRAKVERPMDGRLITLLERVGSYSAVGRFLRATWLETLPTDKEFLNGVLRVGPAAQKFQRLLQIPQPVPRLEPQQALWPEPQAELRSINSCRDIFGAI
jgi:hypothetical protein